MLLPEALAMGNPQPSPNGLTGFSNGRSRSGTDAVHRLDGGGLLNGLKV